MSLSKKYFQRRLTLREAFLVVVILAVVGGLGYAIYTTVAAKILEARVETNLPKIRAEIQEQRKTLIDAIEAYRAHFGFYPPDNITNRSPLQIDALNNSLLYELCGTFRNAEKRRYDMDGFEGMPDDYIKDFFHSTGFKNSSETRGAAKRFLKLDPLPFRQLHDDPDAFGLAYVPSESIPAEIVWELEISPWLYVSSAATNNPGKFDLWMELQTKNRKITIGNWKAAE